MSHWIALLLAIVGNVGANISFKHFVQNTEFRATWNSVGVAAAQPSFWIGCIFAFCLMGFYLYAIRVLPLGLAYTTATSLSIAGITLAGVFVFGETISLRAMIGIGVILLGILLITTGSSETAAS